MNKDKENKKNIVNNKYDQNFSIISNRFSYYYKQVFNIEIISIFVKNKFKIKNKKQKSENQMLKNSLEEKIFNNKYVYILIKDKNKLIFQYKIIKVHLNRQEYMENITKYNNFYEYFYNQIDTNISKYCQLKYMNKKNKKKLEEINLKNKKINNDYNNWLKK